MSLPANFATQFSDEIAALAERSRAGVVVIRRSQSGRDGGGAGSGVVWNTAGLIATNHHVVGRGPVSVAFHDGSSYKGEVVYSDPQADLALVKLVAMPGVPGNGSGLPANLHPLPSGDSTRLRTGQLVFALGNPLGIERALTVGVIIGTNDQKTIQDENPTSTNARASSAKGKGVIYADVDVYPGNSGGPLLDAQGRVLGLTAAIVGPGITLAVPSHLIQAAVRQVLQPADVKKGWLGIRVQPAPLPVALRQQIGFQQENGLMLFGIDAGSPAESAGLLPGDVLLGTEVNTGAYQGVEDTDDLISYLSDHVGQPVRFAVLRGGRLHTIEATPISKA